MTKEDSRSVADILRSAIGELRTEVFEGHAWGQGELESASGCKCVYGAIMWAVHGSTEDDLSVSGVDSGVALELCAARTFADANGIAYEPNVVVAPGDRLQFMPGVGRDISEMLDVIGTWNDHGERTFEDVEAGFARAIELAEAGK